MISNLENKNTIDHEFYANEFNGLIETLNYDDIKIYYDWDEWEEYGYVACKSNDTWKLVKVIQYPKPKYEVVGDGFLTAKEAMKSVGINDSERYRR